MAEESKLRFVCGKQTFTLRRDPETGTWDHDGRVLQAVHRYQREGRAENFEIVGVVCEMLTDSLTTPSRGVTAAKKLWKIAIGERPRIIDVVPDVLMACLKLGSLDKSVVGLWNTSFCSMSQFEYDLKNHADLEIWPHLPSLRFDPEVDEGAWLRHAMEASDSMRGSEPFDDNGFNPELAVAIAALNMSSAWRQDLMLWPDYLTWAFRYPKLGVAAAGALPKVCDERERSLLLETPLHEFVIAGRKDQTNYFGQPASELWRALADHSPDMAERLQYRDQGNIGLRMWCAASILKSVEMDLSSSHEAREQVAWSIALSELRSACTEAGGVVLAGRDHAPLRTVFFNAWEKADSILGLPAQGDDLASKWATDMLRCIRKGDFPRPQFMDDYQAVFNDF